MCWMSPAETRLAHWRHQGRMLLVLLFFGKQQHWPSSLSHMAILFTLEPLLGARNLSCPATVCAVGDPVWTCIQGSQHRSFCPKNTDLPGWVWKDMCWMSLYKVSANGRMMVVLTKNHRGHVAGTEGAPCALMWWEVHRLGIMWQ